MRHAAQAMSADSPQHCANLSGWAVREAQHTVGKPQLNSSMCPMPLYDRGVRMNLLSKLSIQ